MTRSRTQLEELEIGLSEERSGSLRRGDAGSWGMRGCDAESLLGIPRERGDSTSTGRFEEESLAGEGTVSRRVSSAWAL